MILKNDVCSVKIFDDDQYSIGSEYNARLYDLLIKPKDEPENYSTFGIEIEANGKKYSVALIGDDNACVGSHTALLDGDKLVVIQSSRIVALSVTSGKLIAATNVGSDGIYFGVYRAKDGYVLHGENKIAMLDGDFNELWSVFGDDVFVCPDRECDFAVEEDKIVAYDFLDRLYHIGFDGKIKRLN